MEDKIREFVEDTLTMSKSRKQKISASLIRWHYNYAAIPKEDKIITLVNEILPINFEDKVIQRFLDMYFENILVKNYKIQVDLVEKWSHNKIT
jgi:hypothetical protein